MDYTSEIEAELTASRDSAEPHDYTKEIEAELPTAPKQPAQPKNADLKYNPDRTLGFGAQAKASFSSDDAEWLRSAAQSLYPNEPLDQAVKRFGKTAEGRYYHKSDDGTLNEVTPPGLSWSNVGSGVGYAIPAAAGLAAGVLTSPAAATGIGAAGTVAAAAGAGGAGEWLRQGIGDVILGDASTGELNKTAIATEGMLSGAGQGVGVGMGKWLQRFAAPDVARMSQSAADDLYDKASNLKTKLTPGEATGLQSQIAEQKRLTSVPQSANIMDDFYKARNKDAATDIRAFLDTVSPARDASILGKEAKDVAETAYAGVKAARTAKVTPFYTKAAAKTGQIDVTDLVDDIEARMKVEKGSVRAVLERARNLLLKPGTSVETIVKDANGNVVPGVAKADIPYLPPGYVVENTRQVDDTFRGLDSAKKAIDGILNQGKLAQETQGLDTWAKAVLTDVRDELVRRIEVAGKSGAGKNSYKTGRRKYQEITESVVKPAKEALAPLLRINPETSTVVRAAKSMLDPSTRAPAQIKLARDLIEKKDPATWNGLVRAYLQQEAHAALQPLAKGEASNVPGRLSKALGDENVLANLRAALPTDKMRAFEDMLDVFRAAARSLDANSDTAFKLEAIQRAKRRDMGPMAKLIEIVRPWEKAKAAQDFFAEKSIARQAEAIAKIITSGDRAAINRLRSLKHYKPNDWRRMAIIGDVLVRGGLAVADKATD